jgi:hypothetical protein
MPCVRDTSRVIARRKNVTIRELPSTTNRWRNLRIVASMVMKLNGVFVTGFSIASRVVILAGIAALAAIAIAGWFLRDQVYQTLQDPGEPYQTYSPPIAGDYAEADSWYVRGTFDDETQPAVFFVHPTTYSGGFNWNAPLDKASAASAVTTLVLPNYAAPFESSGELFAPRYRQAALYAFMNNREDGVLARLFAYADVERAFAQFLTDIGEDRPFILVGVGQGGLHMIGLLIHQVAPVEDLTSRLVAAYILEASVPLDLFAGPLANIPPCETPDDVGCIYSFSAAHQAEERRIRIMTERSMSWTPASKLGFVEGRGLLCTNPLLSTRSTEFASARQHRGGVAAEGFTSGVMPASIPAQTSAQCTDGILLIDRPRSPVLRRPQRLAEDYREPPFNLFYEDMRLDAARRTSLLVDVLAEARRWAPALEDPEDVREAPVTPIPDRSEYP